MQKNKFKTLLFVVALTFCWIINSNFNVNSSESQLSKLMRTMSNDVKSTRVKIIAGEKILPYQKKYKKLITAKASADSKKGEHYEEYAQLFLVQYDRFYSCEKSTQKKEFNNLISTCVRCHETYCPGPLTMIKKMKISPE